jgi:hypothetical protein
MVFARLFENLSLLNLLPETMKTAEAVPKSEQGDVTISVAQLLRPERRINGFTLHVRGQVQEVALRDHHLPGRQ